MLSVERSLVAILPRPCNVCLTNYYKQRTNSRWQDGATGGSGEDTEQIFSYLSRLNLTTKNMTAAGMHDCITYIHCVSFVLVLC